MSKYDIIDEVGVEKGHDEITEIEKFNPFHDAQGRFSNKNGFKSYSANPNTRAGAMAIARSAAAGHGNTPNVHRESYGENIRQNANWMGSGKPGTWYHGRQSTGNATLARRVEPAAGLAGASATGASWQHQNQHMGRPTKPGKTQPQQQAPAAQKPAQKPAQAQTKPAAQKPAQQPQQAQNNANQNASTQTLASKVSDVKLSSGDKLAIQQRNGYGQTGAKTKKIAADHDQDIVNGKDISKTADISKIKGSKDPIDKMAELQGWNKGSTVTNDLETFQKAAKKSGTMLIRSVHDNRRTGETADSICKKTMTDGDAALGGTGAQAYGSGLYMVGANFGTSTGKTLGRKIQASQNESYYYGDTQMMATVHPSAKIATPSQARKIQNEFYGLSRADQQRFGRDVNTYIASKGYDGAQWHTNNTPYVTMYNKSALIYYGEASSQY